MIKTRRLKAMSKKGNKCYILYYGDRWLSKQSLVVVSVCTSLESAISLAKKASDVLEERLTQEQERELYIYQQTENRENNFLIAEEELNCFTTYFE